MAKRVRAGNLDVVSCWIYINHIPHVPHIYTAIYVSYHCLCEDLLLKAFSTGGVNISKLFLLALALFSFSLFPFALGCCGKRLTRRFHFGRTWQKGKSRKPRRPLPLDIYYHIPHVQHIYTAIYASYHCLCEDLLLKAFPRVE